MRNLTMIVVLVVLSVAGSSSAKNLIYVSEKNAVCFVPTKNGLAEGHWECDLDTGKCHCVMG